MRSDFDIGNNRRLARKPRRGQATAANKRKWLRFSNEIPTVTLWTDERTSIHAAVADESFGGIAVLLLAKSRMRLGQRLEIEYQGAKMPAQVRYIRRQRDGQNRVGFEWTSATQS